MAEVRAATQSPSRSPPPPQSPEAGARESGARESVAREAGPSEAVTQEAGPQEAGSPETGPQETASPAVNHTPQPNIEAQDDEDDGDEGDGYETASNTSTNDTSSLASSIRDYNFENKRRYHKFKEGRYAFPNDDAEQEREDMKHAMVVTLCGGTLHSAPLENPHKILDIGTGTGIWAIDMGDEYPEAEVTGIDLSPIQPAYVPVNVSFVVDDAEAEWLYSDDSIDYIHIRNMGAAIKDWDKLLAQAYRCLKPGGWIELQEMKWNFNCDDETMPPTYAVTKMMKHIWEGLNKFGIEADVADTNPQRLKDAGFVNQVHDVQKVPVGEWPKREDLRMIGAYCKAVIYDGLHGITVGPLTRGLGWSSEEVEVFLIDVRKDLLNTSIHSYVFYHSLAGQKPLKD
ncbi:Putative S-adenosyl-L-methionine-dependent methyltransferase superfamily [Colletotrichum destructivum]|uniref:S-adenosyl-L-methionine-dependent methyltransferase superfamily n=1 Tax=Colletotrichum destructivum TaxID=34406 RepID=A0AAX4I6X0_9PEZI|nr:Putative S-adenosyl-L-methionine-dependent methyltransferase superfamily [Colletotrichum destructivum]